MGRSWRSAGPRFDRAFRTGRGTVAVPVVVRRRDGSHLGVLGQFVRIDGSWRVAWSTTCAVAVTDGVPCRRVVPTLFPGEVWRSDPG